MAKIVVRYNHVPSDLKPIYLALDNPEMVDVSWIPAFRDVVQGKKVVFVRASQQPSELWIKDNDGIRKVKEKDIVS